MADGVWFMAICYLLIAICSSRLFSLQRTAMNGGQTWLLPEVAFPEQPGAYETECYARGFKCIAGLDEAGRGTWAGPVVAAAVVFPRELLASHSKFCDSKLDPPGSMLEIKDSKLLTPKKRELLALWIKDKAAAWGVGIVDSDKIDRINILKASLLAMTQALQQVRPSPDFLLIDGSQKIPAEFLRQAERDRQQERGLMAPTTRFWPHPLPLQQAIKHGDRLCLSISAASILAKVERDRIMRQYDRFYPQYGFARHKGYGSPSHLAALERYGPSPIHRASFKPVRNLLDRAAGDRSAVLTPKQEKL